MKPTPPEDATSIAYRLIELSGTNAWNVIITKESETAEFAAALADAVNAIAVGHAERRTALSALELERVLGEASSRVLVIDGVEAIDSNGWAKLDRDRTRIGREGVVALVSSAATFDRLQRFAPNLGSWVGAAFFKGALQTPERWKSTEHRLEELRAWAELDDETLVARAERGELPADPLFTEWLVLLDRGDLVVKG
jgi:hypothetical protein